MRPWSRIFLKKYLLNSFLNLFNMDPLSFLYIALGVGFLILVIFICATLIYVIQILRDASKITDSVRDTAERVNDYIIQPFAFINKAVQYVKPVIEEIQRKRHQMEKTVNEHVHKAAKKFRKKMNELGEEEL